MKHFHMVVPSASFIIKGAFKLDLYSGNSSTPKRSTKLETDYSNGKSVATASEGDFLTIED